MTHLVVTDDLAADLTAMAKAHRTSTDLLRSMLSQWESDQASLHGR